MSERGIAGPNSPKTLLQGAIRGLQKPACWHPSGRWVWFPEVTLVMSFTQRIWRKRWPSSLGCHSPEPLVETHAVCPRCPRSCGLTGRPILSSSSSQNPGHPVTLLPELLSSHSGAPVIWKQFIFFLTFESYTRTILLLNWVSVEASRPGEWKIGRGVCSKPWKAWVCHNGRNPCKGLNYHTRWRQLWIPLAAVA